jgi:hypothetical protein
MFVIFVNWRGWRGRPIASAEASGYAAEEMMRALAVVIAVMAFAGNFFATAQTNAPQTNPATSTNYHLVQQRSEQMRAVCIAERRSICGKILRIFPNGILVESGYTNLVREPLTRSWLVPGTVTASRADNLVESREPGALCVGTVFLSDLPRGKPKPYDYVIICGYPSGEFRYTSAGAVRKTVRSFSANVDKAVQANLAARQEPKAR